MASSNGGGWRRWLGWTGVALAGLGAVSAGALALAGLMRREGRGSKGRRPRAGRRSSEVGSGLSLKRAWVPGPAGSLYLEEVGQGGLPLILVHGLAATTRQWSPLLDLLGRSRHVVALDLRGHGRSDPAAHGDYHIEDYASDVLAVADALRLRTFALTGHSLGGLVAVECAGRHPERVAILALVDSSGDSSQLPSEELESLLAAVAKEPLGEVELHFRQLLAGAHPATSKVVLEDLAQTPEELLAPSLTAAMSYPGAETLGRYPGVVCCLVSAFNDSPQSLHNRCSGLSVRRVRGASHWLMLDRPEELALALDGLLALAGQEVPS